MRGWARWTDPNPKTVSTGEFTIPFSIGDKISDLFLFLRSGTCTPAQITLMKLQLNGITVWTLTGTELDAMNQYFGFSAFAGAAGDVLRIPFGLPDMIDSRTKDMTAINTGSKGPGGKIIESGTLTVQLTGATNATFETYARVTDQMPGGPGMIRRFTKYTEDQTTDLTPISVRLPHGEKESALWARLWLRTSAGTIDENMILADGRRVNGLTPVQVSNLLQTDEGLDPTGGGLYQMVWTTSAEGIGTTPMRVGENLVPGNLPYFNTLPFKGKNIEVHLKNSVAGGTNTIILETIGEF